MKRAHFVFGEVKGKVAITLVKLPNNPNQIRSANILNAITVSHDF
jgi:hypothetical protein